MLAKTIRCPCYRGTPLYEPEQKLTNPPIDLAISTIDSGALNHCFFPLKYNKLNKF